jgi:SNF2 family DNA or RNA helicase
MLQSEFIRDNYQCGSVGEYLQEQIKPGSKLSIVSAFFTIYAYQQLKEKLDSIDHLRFLFGDPSFLKNIDPDKTNFREYQIVDKMLTIPLDKRLSQKRTAKECAQWIMEKVDIRSMVRPDFVHGKMYHITQESGVEKAIVGSSNFTVNGLGLGGKHNIELNITIDSESLKRDLKKWFDTLWDDQTGLVVDVKEQVLSYLEQIYAENNPEFIYYKTLFHLFEKFLDEQETGGLLDEKSGFYDSDVWNMLYGFQKDGVKGAINKILKHNGCIIADSVGLGKTFEALAVIKYFESLNQRVLVLCPKKLRSNWTIYQANQNHALNPLKKDRFNYTLLFHTDLQAERKRSDSVQDLENFNWGAYDLVVIDESHNFRGNPIEKIKEDGSKRMNRAMWLMEKIIRSGSRTRVLMLSATPVNNTLKDLRNQIAYITEGREDAMIDCCGIPNISQLLNNAQKQFTTWSKRPKSKQSVKQLLELLDSGFFKLLDELTIARSRKHIKDFYHEAAASKFPQRLKPESLYPSIDLKNRFPSYDSLNEQIMAYKLSIFNPSAYVIDPLKEKYEKMSGNTIPRFTQEDRECYLIGMMKVNYLKRLESSIKSFEISLDRTICKIEALIKKIEDYQALPTQDHTASLDYEEPIDADDEEENGIDTDSTMDENWQVGKKLKFNLADLRLDQWLIDLKKDKDALVGLYNNARSVTPESDAKLTELKQLIEKKILHPTNHNNKKILIFTAFTDTAEYLYQNLSSWHKSKFQLHSAMVSGSKTMTTLGKNDYDSILVNFSPRSKNRAHLQSSIQDSEIDLLIATDCISEGQNLQDCDYLINYDIHWNPVRIIQRFGRIDRLGSINDTIQLVNFWPTRDLDNYINLKARVEARMALVDVTATGEDNLLNPEQIEELIQEDLKYRNQQLKKLQDQVLDLEEMDESISLTDFTLDDFRLDLLRYIEENKKRLEGAPLGLYALAPAPEHHDIIKPGVIFCLRQKENSEGSEKINPLAPYFLVYIRNDGTVRYNYTHAKHILEIFRKLCQGQKAPYDDLCELFNQETKQGERMERFATLLKQAINEIVQIFRKRGAQKLITDRSAVLIPVAKQVSEMDDFELITWLVIQ